MNVKSIKRNLETKYIKGKKVIQSSYENIQNHDNIHIYTYTKVLIHREGDLENAHRKHSLCLHQMKNTCTVDERISTSLCPVFSVS